jgi:hypothetical protein
MAIKCISGPRDPIQLVKLIGDIADHPNRAASESGKML